MKQEESTLVRISTKKLSQPQSVLCRINVEKFKEILQVLIIFMKKIVKVLIIRIKLKL